MSNSQAKATPRGRPPIWVLIVVGLLSTHLICILVMVRIASRANDGVIPDYYRQATNWDSTQAQRRASEKLGWRVQVVPETAVA